jgi:hypothetical protein
VAIGELQMMNFKDILIEEFEKEFENIHLSRNLANTIRWERNETGYAIVIPAQTYKMYQFFKNGVVIHDGKGSYASELNISGSSIALYNKKGKKHKLKSGGYNGHSNVKHLGNHVGYIDKCIQKAVQRWIGTTPEYNEYKME